MSHHLRRALLWGAGLLGVGALAVLVAVLLVIRHVVTPAFVAERASSVLGREVSVGAVGLYFKPLPRIRLERVAIAPDIGLGRVDVGLRVVSLLQGEIELDRVEVEDASFTLVRRADGGVELYGAVPAEAVETQESVASVESPESEGAFAPLSLPKIDLRRVSVSFVDHAVADPQHQISFEVRRLELEPVATGERSSLSVAVAIGESGKGGLLTLDAELGPLEAEVSIGQQPVRARLQLAALAPAFFLPYLPPDLDVRRLEGALEGSVALEGRPTGELAADLAVSLVEGVADVAGVGVSAPRFEGRLERRDGALAVTKARLEAAVVDFAAHRVRNLRAAFSFAADTVEVESLDFDSYTGKWRRAGDATAGQGGAADLELHVKRTGRIALGGRLRLPSETDDSAGRRFGVELPEVEVRDAQLAVVAPARPEVPPVSLQVSLLRLHDFAEGKIASYSLEARTGANGGGGSVTVRGAVGPLAWEKPLDELPFSLELAAEAIDLASLAPYAPERWRPIRAEGLLSAKIAAEGPARAGSAQMALRLDGGGLELAGIELQGRSVLEGRIRRRGDVVTVESGQLTSETLSFADRRAEDLRARFAFADEALEIESLDLRAYGGTLHHAGRFVLGEVPSFDLRLEVAGVDAGRLLGVAVEGADPTLLEGEIAVRGPWTDQPNWLEPVRGEGRVLLSGGVLPAQDLLTAVARSLLRFIPGSSGLLRGSPRFSRLEQVTSTFRIEGGRVHTDDLGMRSDDFGASGRGSVGHELDLDLSIDVALTTGGMEKVFALARTSSHLSEAARLPAVPVRVTGPIGSPSFRADASGVPLATLRGVLGLPGRAGAATRGAIGTVRDAAGAAGGGLLGGAQRLRRGREANEPPPDILP
jgi:hypothetical protein